METSRLLYDFTLYVGEGACPSYLIKSLPKEVYIRIYLLVPWNIRYNYMSTKYMQNISI